MFFRQMGCQNYPLVSQTPVMKDIEKIEIPVLIIGGGPAGLSAAIELGKLGVKVLLIDDKHRLGGKFVLQTHRFFGSSQAVYAGTRGIDIAAKLEEELGQYKNVEVWLNTTALGVFSDQYIGILHNSETLYPYQTENIICRLRSPRKVLILYRQHPTWSLRCGCLSNIGKSRPDPPGREAIYRWRGQCWFNRWIPCPTSRHWGCWISRSSCPIAAVIRYTKINYIVWVYLS